MIRPLRALAALAAAAAAYGAGVAAAVPDTAPLASGPPPVTRYMQLRAADRGLAAAAAARPAGVPIERISPVLVCAVVKAEDRTFFRHAGVLWEEVPRVAARALRPGRAAGGSTITQQLARNLYLSPARTPHRKLREAAIARQLERGLPKRRILELYLNGIEWGDGVWGVESASRHYLGHGAAEVDAFEAAFLASLVAAPRHPLAGANAERAQRVQRRVLRQLRASGVLDERALRAAWSRSDTLFSALEAGRELPHALALARARSSPPEGADDGGAVERLLANGCGIDRELATEIPRR